MTEGNPCGMIDEWMLKDMDHERTMLMWFMRQRSCKPIERLLIQLLNEVVTWMVKPEIQEYPNLCRQTAEVSKTAWEHIHGYLPPRDDKRGAA